MSLALLLVIYLVIGIVSGIIGGMLGIGGGSIMVPSLLLLFSYIGFPEESLMHLAIGTSLAAMVINTGTAAYFHNRRSSVVWKVVLRVLAGIIVGSFLGSFLGSELSSNFLKKFFGVCACGMGISFVFPAPVPSEENHRMPTWPLFTLISVGISTLANILGIGGGIFMIPLLLYFRFPERKAVGTSSATSFLISLGGAIGYLIAADKEVPIADCVGYVYIPAFLIMGVGSVFASFHGVKWAHSLPSPVLRKLFAAMMITVGISMLLS